MDKPNRLNGLQALVITLAISIGVYFSVSANLRSVLTTFRAESLVQPSQVYVPAGEFIMGGDTTHNGRGGVISSERGTVYLAGFWISKTQVTNWQYSRCVEAGACRPPARRAYNAHYYNRAYSNHPVVYVSWFDAQKYCAWVGGRLPSEAEWEKAARGTDGRSFPWGEEGQVEWLARVGRDMQARTTMPVGSYLLGASPYGALDMGGNVREWVDDWYDASRVVLRGAAWYDPPVYSLTYARLAHEPASPGQGRGFRCAFDP